MLRLAKWPCQNRAAFFAQLGLAPGHLFYPEQVEAPQVVAALLAQLLALLLVEVVALHGANGPHAHQQALYGAVGHIKVHGGAVESSFNLGHHEAAGKADHSDQLSGAGAKAEAR